MTFRHRTRDYDGDRRERARPLSPFERAALVSLLRRGRVYERVMVDHLERSVQDRWAAEGRAPARPWFPVVDNVYGTVPAPQPAVSSDESRLHFIAVRPLFED